MVPPLLADHALQALEDGALAGVWRIVVAVARRWVLREPLVASALIGASSVAQLEQNVAALDAAPLGEDEIARLEPFAANGTVLG